MDAFEQFVSPRVPAARLKIVGPHSYWDARPSGYYTTLAERCRATLARAACLSSSHLSRIFKEQIGVSISQFRNQQRLQRFLRFYGAGRRTTALAAMVSPCIA